MSLANKKWKQHWYRGSLLEPEPEHWAGWIMIPGGTTSLICSAVHLIQLWTLNSEIWDAGKCEHLSLDGYLKMSMLSRVIILFLSCTIFWQLSASCVLLEDFTRVCTRADHRTFDLTFILASPWTELCQTCQVYFIFQREAWALSQGRSLSSPPAGCIALSWRGSAHFVLACEWNNYASSSQTNCKEQMEWWK